MTKTKKTHHPKTTRSRAAKHPKSRALSKPNLLTFFIVIIVALIWFVAAEQLEPKASVLRVAAAAIAPTSSYNSLDLTVDRNASYSSPPIKTVKDIGIVDGVHHEVISFSVPKDNLSEYGYMTLPAEPAPNGRYPVIIFCHGYANPAAYSTSSMYLNDMEFYSRHGYAVIKPDFRGQGLSLTKGTPDGAYYSMSYNTDVLSLIAAAKRTSYLDARDINLWGHSMGAYIALRAAILSPDIKNVILLSLPGDVLEQTTQTQPVISDTDNPQAAAIRASEVTLHGSPQSNLEYWQKTSPLNYLGNTNAFIQIHVGSLDGLVPPISSANLDKKLNLLSKPHAYYSYSGGFHGLVAQRDVIWQRSLEQLAKK